jgi:hypothetical protein
VQRWWRDVRMSWLNDRRRIHLGPIVKDCDLVQNMKRRWISFVKIKRRALFAEKNCTPLKWLKCEFVKTIGSRKHDKGREFNNSFAMTFQWRK